LDVQIHRKYVQHCRGWRRCRYVCFSKTNLCLPQRASALLNVFFRVKQPVEIAFFRGITFYVFHLSAVSFTWRKCTIDLWKWLWLMLAKFRILTGSFKNWETAFLKDSLYKNYKLSVVKTTLWKVLAAEAESENSKSRTKF
jgi:hypothetical protein